MRKYSKVEAEARNRVSEARDADLALRRMQAARDPNHYWGTETVVQEVSGVINASHALGLTDSSWAIY